VPNLTIHPTGEVIHLEPGETVLGGLYKAGYAYTIGCRRGGCAICKVDVLEGEFSYERPVADSVISEQERTDGTCLSCRAVPDSDLTIEMRDDCLRLVNPFLHQINEKARLRADALVAGTTTKE
jgi:CDP-4-dehydro-6-deoxyglucose reductase